MQRDEILISGERHCSYKVVPRYSRMAKTDPPNFQEFCTLKVLRGEGWLWGHYLLDRKLRVVINTPWSARITTPVSRPQATRSGSPGQLSPRSWTGTPSAPVNLSAFISSRCWTEPAPSIMKALSSSAVTRASPVTLSQILYNFSCFPRDSRGSPPLVGAT